MGLVSKLVFSFGTEAVISKRNIVRTNCSPPTKLFKEFRKRHVKYSQKGLEQDDQEFDPTGQGKEIGKCYLWNTRN